jgi:hypothetical protein
VRNVCSAISAAAPWCQVLLISLPPESLSATQGGSAMTERVEKICTSCNRVFCVAPEFAWQRLCRQCFANERSAQVQVRELQAEVSQLRGELARERIGRRKGFDVKQWQRLVMLCHPDRNQDSPASLAATQWLMSVREEFSDQ